jgi:hypothetical protein
VGARGIASRSSLHCTGMGLEAGATWPGKSFNTSGMPTDRPRAGARGGQDQFSWEQVKEDKYRQHYLGASIHGVPERFKRRAEMFWYLKSETSKSSASKELEAIRAKESELMSRMLGGEPSGSATASARSLSPNTGPEMGSYRKQRSKSPLRRGRHPKSPSLQSSRRQRSRSRDRNGDRDIDRDEDRMRRRRERSRSRDRRR